MIDTFQFAWTLGQLVTWSGPILDNIKNSEGVEMNDFKKGDRMNERQEIENPDI